MTNPQNRELILATSIPPEENVYVIDTPDFKSKDEKLIEVELLEKINKAIQHCQAYKEELWNVSEKGRQYYQGNQVKDWDLYEGETKQVDNRIFTSIETLIPLTVKNLSEPIFTLTPINKRTTQLKEKLRNYLYNDLYLGEWDMKTTHAQAVRTYFTDRYAAYKIFYNFEKECLDVTLVPRGRLYVPREARNEDGLPYLVELVRETVGDLLTKFPDKKDELIELIGKGKPIDINSPIDYFEYWENEIIAWKYKNIVLGWDKNPTFNWDNPLNNHFKTPKIPYVFLRQVNFGDSIIDPTSMVEQVLGLQDGINKRKRQIENNADLGNGMLISSGDFTTKESFDKIDYSPKSKLWLSKGIPSQAVHIETGRAFDQGIFQDMKESQNEIDNILGTHPATRGGATPNTRTLGAQMMLKTADSGRLETLMRAISTVDKALYDWAIQLMYVFYTEKHPIMSLNQSGDLRKMSELQRKNFISAEEFKNTVIRIRTEINVGKDSSEAKVEAINLFKLGCLSNKDLLKILGYPNAETLAQNAMMEKVKPDQVYPLMNAEEPFDVEAINHTELMLAGEDITQPQFLTQTQDINMLNNHLKTHLDYIQGVEIEQDLEMFADILPDNQKIYSEHIRLENEMLKQMLMMQQQMGQMQPQIQGQPQQTQTGGVGGGIQQTPNTGVQSNPMPQVPNSTGLTSGLS